MLFKNLGKRIKGINQGCRMCNAAIEDVEHIFFHCPVAVMVFFGSPLGCRTEQHRGLSSKQIIAGWLAEKGNYDGCKMAGCVMWALWKNRNEEVFNNKDQSIQNIIKETLFWYNYINPTLLEEEHCVTSVHKKKEANKWSPPETEWTKHNTDAAYKDFNGGWAVVARNADIKFAGCGTMAHKVLSPIEAETRAVLLAADFAVMSHLQKVIIECDAEKVVNMLSKKNCHIHHLIFQIRDQLKKAAEVKRWEQCCPCSG